MGPSGEKRPIRGWAHAIYGHFAASISGKGIRSATRKQHGLAGIHWIKLEKNGKNGKKLDKMEKNWIKFYKIL